MTDMTDKVDKAVHVRIDEGVKRGKRQMRQEARSEPASTDVRTYTVLDPQTRSQLILEAPERIRRGETTTQIAKSYGISPSTLTAWLVGDDRAEEARGAMLAQELIAKAEDIETAPDPLALARAREGFRAWSWIAERRQARLYAQKQEVTGKDGGPLQVQIVRFGQTIEGQSTVLSTPQEGNAALLQPIIEVGAKDGKP